jgi:hypothetical protein
MSVAVNRAWPVCPLFSLEVILKFLSWHRGESNRENTPVQVDAENSRPFPPHLGTSLQAIRRAVRTDRRSGLAQVWRWAPTLTSERCRASPSTRRILTLDVPTPCPFRVRFSKISDAVCERPICTLRYFRLLSAD